MTGDNFSFPLLKMWKICAGERHRRKKKFEEKHVSLLSKCWAELIREFHANRTSSAVRIAGFHF